MHTVNTPKDLDTIADIVPLMQNIFFTADTHFGHSNIIKYCNRPFNSHEEMDAEILKRFNSVIKRGDILYHLGDVSWSTYDLDKFFSRLNTKEVHLIYGNHDKPKVTRHPHIRSYCDIRKINPGHPIVLCHYAMNSWPGKGSGSFQLFGHSHGKLAGIGRSMDVGVDTNNFYPYEFSEIKDKLSQIPFKHHEE